MTEKAGNNLEKDPEVVEKAARRRFTAEYKRRIALEAERCREALDQVDAAAISTLHAFAQRILSEHSVDAGLPPSIEVLDEISSQVAFDQRWRDFLDQLLDEPDCGDQSSRHVGSFGRPDRGFVTATDGEPHRCANRRPHPHADGGLQR